MHLNVMFSNETDLKNFQDFLYQKSSEGKTFTGLLESMLHEVTIVTAVHSIKSNKGSKTAGVDKISIDRYLQMSKGELIALIQKNSEITDQNLQGVNIFRKVTEKHVRSESPQCSTELYRNV